MFKKKIWKIKRKIKRIFIKISKNTRPSSAPHISGDGFRSLAHHIYESSCNFNPCAVSQKEIIFVESERLKFFLKNIHPKIRNPYILISHNGDTNIDNSFVSFIDEKIIHWFAQNVIIKHPKITPIPIGLENKHYANSGDTNLYIKQTPPFDKKIPFIGYSFSISTNPQARNAALKILSSTSVAKPIHECSTFISQSEYIQLVSPFMFIASPEGNGLDCHRTWEALYLGIIPIVLKSESLESFKDIGLPILILENWSDLKYFTHEKLSETYRSIKSKEFINPLYFEYWKSLIQKYS